MAPEIDIVGALDVHSLRDALGIGIDLIELFGPDVDFCGLWLGMADGTMRDFVVCTEDRGRDVDGPGLADEFFGHASRLGAVGLQLVDEIALWDEELRSLAVTTFTDPDGWDDVTAGIIDAFPDEGRPPPN